MSSITPGTLTYEQRLDSALRCTSHGGPCVTSREVHDAIRDGREMAVDWSAGERVPLFVPASLHGSVLTGAVSTAGQAGGHDFTPGEPIAWHVSKGPFFGEHSTVFIGSARRPPAIEMDAAAVIRVAPYWKRGHELVREAVSLAAALRAGTPLTLPPVRWGDHPLAYAGDCAYVIECAAGDWRHRTGQDGQAGECLAAVARELRAAIADAEASGAWPPTAADDDPCQARRRERRPS